MLNHEAYSPMHHLIIYDSLLRAFFGVESALFAAEIKLFVTRTGCSSGRCCLWLTEVSVAAFPFCASIYCNPFFSAPQLQCSLHHALQNLLTWNEIVSRQANTRQLHLLLSSQRIWRSRRGCSAGQEASRFQIFRYWLLYFIFMTKYDQMFFIVFLKIKTTSFKSFGWAHRRIAVVVYELAWHWHNCCSGKLAKWQPCYHEAISDCGRLLLF